MMRITLDGAAGAKAVELARAKYGGGYDCYVAGMHSSERRFSANVTAYNKEDQKDVQVDWEQ